jgi:ankyrin repeat protein
MATFLGYVDIVRVLLDYGADVNGRDNHSRTPLMWAALKGHGDIARILIKAGADLFATDKFGYSAWQLASEGKQTKILQILTEAGVNKENKSIMVAFRGPKSSMAQKFGWSGWRGYFSAVR